MYDSELEDTLAKILFHNPHLLDYDLLDMNDFFSDIKYSINNMIKIVKNGGKIDKITVGREFSEPLETEVNSFHDYVKSLKSLSSERKLQEFPHSASLIVSKSNTSFDDRINELHRILDGYVFTKGDCNDYLIGNLLNAFMDDLCCEDKVNMIRTDIKDLDIGINDGIERGDLVIIAGDTGNFKSALAYNIALNVALQGLPVMFFSYEISLTELQRKFVSMIARINSNVLRTGKMTDGNGNLVSYLNNDDVVTKINNAVNELSKLPLYLFTGDMGLNDIKLHGMKIKPALIFVDYIQIMPDVTTDMVKSIGHISRTLKRMANKDILNCGIVALSQFKKSEDEIKERTLNDLKYNSSISQDANLVLFTKKKSTLNRTDGTETTTIEIKVVKNRSGSNNIKIELPIIPKWGVIKNESD